mgnify:CR=1 FL=1
MFFRFTSAWQQISRQEQLSDLPVSVIIPFRNEEKNLKRLAKGLAQQSHENFELIFVDDHSDDEGPELLLKYLKGQSLTFRLFRLDESTGKKAAITKGVQESRNALIVTTDADCYMDANWLRSMVAQFENEQIHLVSGPVSLIKNSRM